jgi:hypothetical protein
VVGRFYSAVDNKPDFMECAIICGKHPLNGYCFQVITTKGEGIRERKLFYDAGNTTLMSAPRVWVHIIEYLIETKDSGKLLKHVSALSE